MGIKNTRNNLVESFFIQHSLPRFPLSQNHLFDSNISKRAQHFVCVSMRDEFTGQGGGGDKTSKIIKIDSVNECNFFKLFWHYSRNVNVNFLRNGSDLVGLAQINIFKEILLSLPNYPIVRFGTNENGVPSHLDLTSFTIESTGNETNRLTFQIFAKAPNYNVDIYDDVTALFSIHHADYNSDNTVDTLKTAHLEGKTAMIMIAQSHSDPATLGINQKVLVDRDNFFATVHILNSARIKLPTVDGDLVIKESMYRDHSKWSVNVVYGLEGNFPPLLCFYDLNRSTKQAKRGGGAFCLNSSVTGSSPASLDLWELFMSFYPDPNSMARLNNADINEILGKVLPKAGSESSDSPIIVNSSPQTQSPGRFTRISSSKKRRHSISETIPMSMIRSAILSKAEYSDENDRIKILHPNTEIPSNIPCPYKFCTAASNIKRNGSIPTKMILNIDKAVEKYGFTKLNQALINYKLIIISTDPLDGNALQTPSGKREKSLNSDFTHNTVFVNRKRQKTEVKTPQSELDSIAEPGDTENSSSSEAKKSNLSRSCVKMKKSNFLRPNTNPRTIRSLRLNSKTNNIHSITDRELEFSGKNFMHSTFSRNPNPKTNGKRDIDVEEDSEPGPYENMYSIAK